MNEDGTPRSGIKFGNFEVLANDDGTPQLLGGGAYGKTYKSVHSFLGTVAALKVIHDSFAYDSGVRKRFLGDAKSLARLSHPHIVKIIDCGEEDGQLYYAMEYCDGGDLEKLASSRGALADETVLLLGKQAAKALAYVHQQGWLHRDLKPSNFMLAMVSGQNEANLKLIDFGLVKALGQENAGGMTQTGQFLGTLLFASPEQLREEELDERTDVFSLGLTLWFLLEGKLPFKGKPAQVVAQRLSGQSYHDSLPKEAHPVVKVLLDKMMHPDREQRFRNMTAVLTAIEKALSELHGTGLIALPEKAKPTPVTPASATEDRSSTSKVGLVTSNQRLGTVYELGEEDKEIQTDLGLRCRARQLPKGDVVHLTIVRKTLAADTVVVQHLDQMVSKASTCSGRFLIRPLSFVQFLDQLSLAEEYVEGLSLLSVLRIKRSLTLPESSPILRQLAEACDLAKAAGITTLELVAHRVLFQFPRQIVASLSGGGMERVIAKPVGQWPPFLVRLAPAYTAAQKHLSSTQGSNGNMSVYGGATIINTDEAADSPQRFARLVYRILSGHPLPAAAMMSKAAYVPITRLSEEGNRLLSEVICGEMHITDCLSVLSQLWRLEGLPETHLSLPKAFDELTNVKSMSAGADVPVAASSQAQAADVVILDVPIPASPVPSAVPTPHPGPVIAGQASLAGLPQGGAPLVPPVVDKPNEKAPKPKAQPQPKPSQPKAREKAAPAVDKSWADEPTKPVVPPVSRPAPAPEQNTSPVATPARPAPPPVEEDTDTWIKKPAPASGSSGSAKPARKEPPPMQPPARAPHLPPGPVKPFPTVMVASVMLGLIVVGVLGWIGKDLLKGDPVKAAVESYEKLQDDQKLNSALVAWAREQPKSRYEESVARAAAVWTDLNKRGKLSGNGSEIAFQHRYDLFQRLDLPSLAKEELRQGQQDNLPAAWKIIAENEVGTELGFEARLHLARMEPPDSDSFEWLMKQPSSAVPARLAADFFDFLKKELRRVQPPEKPRTINTIMALQKGMPGGDNQAAMALMEYKLYSENELLADPKLLEAAAKDLALVKKEAKGAVKEELIRQVARTQSVQGMELWQMYDEAGMKADADPLLARLVLQGDNQAKTLWQDAGRSIGDFNLAWTTNLQLAKGSDPKIASWAAGWIASQDEAKLLARAQEARPVIEGLLTSADNKDRPALALKLAALVKETERTAPDLPWRLYQLYSRNGLSSQAQASLTEAKKANIADAWKESASAAAGTQALTEWLEIAGKVPLLRRDAVQWLSAWALRADKLDPEEVKFVSTVKAALASDPSAGEAVRKLENLEVNQELMQVATLARTHPDEAMAKAHAIAALNTPARQGAIEWLQSNVTVLSRQPLQVDDPLLPGATLSVKGEDWIPGKPVSVSGKDGRMRYFKLPIKLPPVMASASGARVPAVAGEGSISNPCTDKVLTVSRQSWYPGAEVKDADGRPVLLPNDLPLLEARVTKDQITNPFTGEPYELKDWSLWKKGGTLEDTPRRFKLPDTLSPPERLAASFDAMTRQVTSPFTKQPVTVAAADWAPGTSVDDTSDPAMKSIGAKIILPLDLPMLIARLGSKPGEVINPLTEAVMTVPWENWKPGATVGHSKGGKKGEKSFAMPATVSDPQLPGLSPDENAHTVKSPYSGRVVSVASRSVWEKRELIEDPDYPHLSLKVPADAPPWFEPERAKLIAGNYNAVISPYSGETIKVTAENWKTDQVKDPKTGKVAYMPDFDEPVVKIATNLNPFTKTIGNPYTGGDSQKWSGEWAPGATVSWAGKLRIGLPASLPDAAPRPATNATLTSITNPWDGSTKSVTYSDWNRGRIEDGSQRPILLGTPPRDPRLGVTLSKSSTKFTNPYTGEPSTWDSSMSKGATMKWGKFTIVAEDVIDEINGVPSQMQRSFLTRRNGVRMIWDPSGYWYSNAGALLPGGDPDEFCKDLDSVSQGAQVPKHFTFRHVGKGKLECRPKSQ